MTSAVGGGGGPPSAEKNLGKKERGCMNSVRDRGHNFLRPSYKYSPLRRPFLPWEEGDNFAAQRRRMKLL